VYIFLLQFNYSAVEEERDKAKRRVTEHKKEPPPEHPYVKDPAAEVIFAFSPQLAYPEHFLKVIIPQTIGAPWIENP